MTPATLYRFVPRGAFHFGERGIGVEETADILHADTLFAAIVLARLALGEEPSAPTNTLPSLAPFLAGTPPLLLSSALPYAADVLLYPRPHITLGAQKALKQVEYVSAAALALICQGQTLDRDRAERELIQGGRVWVLPAERNRIVDAVLPDEPDAELRRRERERINRDPSSLRIWWGADEPPAPHVAIDRVNSASAVYFTGRLRFAAGCGLYCQAVFADESYRPWLEAALAVLADEGLGGKRSIGHGQFELRRERTTLPAAAEPNAWMALSLYHPGPEELAAGVLDQAWYRRVLRRGWIFSPEGRNQRRRGLWMLAEGSLFRSPVRGTIEDLRPIYAGQEAGLSHPVWRYGYALTLPLHFEALPAHEEAP
jgi:CRISPR-associated protein Csm4